jgi:hypothetical protein
MPLRHGPMRGRAVTPLHALAPQAAAPQAAAPRCSSTL